jgi:UDP-glucose 4-epimerase
MTKILVTGGAGYIGSHTVYALLADGFEVVVADNLETGFRAAVHADARFYEGDIRDEAFLRDLLRREGVDAVIHFAAYSQVGESMENPMKYYDNNLGGALALLSAMLRGDVKNIVFSSTAAVYGEPVRIPICEEDPTKPTNAYGETKLAMEGMMRWFDRAYGLRCAALRYFNACGAHESARIGEAHRPESHLIPLVLQVPGGQRPAIEVYGDDYPTRDGACVRDYVHVMDLADAHVSAARYLLRGGKSDVFNLGSGTGFTVFEVIKTAEEVTGRPIAVRTAPRREGDPAQLVAAGEKARDILGWRPSRGDLHTIIASAWRWHSAHPRGYDTE